MMSGADPGTQMNPDEPKLLAAKLKNVKKITLNTMLPEITKSCDKKKW